MAAPKTLPFHRVRVLLIAESGSGMFSEHRRALPTPRRTLERPGRDAALDKPVQALAAQRWSRAHAAAVWAGQVDGDGCPPDWRVAGATARAKKPDADPCADTDGDPFADPCPDLLTDPLADAIADPSAPARPRDPAHARQAGLVPATDDSPPPSFSSPPGAEPTPSRATAQPTAPAAAQPPTPSGAVLGAGPGAARALSPLAAVARAVEEVSAVRALADRLLQTCSDEACRDTGPWELTLQLRELGMGESHVELHLSRELLSLRFCCRGPGVAHVLSRHTHTLLALLRQQLPPQMVIDIVITDA